MNEMMNMNTSYTHICIINMFMLLLANRWHCLFESPGWEACCWCHAPVSTMTAVYFYHRGPRHGLDS